MNMYMTDERKESVNFSDPYMVAEVVMAKYERSGFDNFMLSLRESFEKNFVREQRWKLIVEGIYTTMLISFFSVVGGTLLGFALYMPGTPTPGTPTPGTPTPGKPPAAPVDGRIAVLAWTLWEPQGGLWEHDFGKLREPRVLCAGC